MLHNSVVALVTPMDQAGSIDWESLDRLILLHLNNNTDAIVVNGTTGESPTIAGSERKELIMFVLDKVAGKIPVIAGTGCNCTENSIILSQEAFNLGVDACMLVTPYYNKPSQQGLIRHYEKISEHCSGKLILYNNPSRTCCDLQPETTAYLSQIFNIIGIKEASPNVNRAKELRELCGNDFLLFSGNDQDCLEFIKLGGDGVISVSANIFPDLLSKMCLAVKNKDYELADKINNELINFHHALCLETNPVAIKWALSYVKLIQNELRLPLLKLSNDTEMGQIKISKLKLAIDEIELNKRGVYV